MHDCRRAVRSFCTSISASPNHESTKRLMSDSKAAPLESRSGDKLNAVDFHWFVVRSLPHQERKLANLLRQFRDETANILEVYCPTHTTVSTRVGGRDVRSPLFGGIVFVLATQQALVNFIASRYPDGAIIYERRKDDGRKAAFLTVPEAQMRFFKDFNENYAEHVVVLERPYSDYAFNPKTGEPNEIVRVIDGPLAGREGYLTRFNRERRLVFNIKAVGSGRHFAVAIPNVWDFHVVRLHNAEGDRQTIGTEKARAADLLIGLLQGCGYVEDALPMFCHIMETLSIKPSLTALSAELHEQGHVALSQRMTRLATKDAELVLNLARYERDNPGYAEATWGSLTLRPFLTPTSGIELCDGAAEAILPHDGFTEVIRKVEITEPTYYPSREKEEQAVATYYAHIGILHSPAVTLTSAAGTAGDNQSVAGTSESFCGTETSDAEQHSHHPSALQPSPHGGEQERGFVLFANWDAFLGEYFLTAGKANERLVSGTAKAIIGGESGAGQQEKLMDSFRNYAPTLYKVLTDETSKVKAVRALKIGSDTMNAMAITAADADLDAAKSELIATGIAICKEINSTTHLAVWRRYLRTVWLHE